MIRQILAACFTPAVVRAEKRYHAVTLASMRQEAQFTYEQSMAWFFDELANQTDPKVEWNRYAELKNDWQKHMVNAEIEKLRCDRLAAKRAASKERFQKLRKGG